MTAELERPGTSPALLLLALAAIAGMLWLALPAASKHAIANHGSNAARVTQRFSGVDPDDDDGTFRKQCPDGKVYTIRQLPGGGAWDVSIDTIGGLNVTRFTSTSKGWVARKLLWCK